MEQEFKVYAKVEGKLAMWIVLESSIELAVKEVKEVTPENTTVLVLIKG